MDKQVENVSKGDKARHSGFGIASFVVASIAIVFQGYFVVSVMNTEGLEMMWPPGWVIFFFLPLPFIVVGIILGVIALQRKEKKRIFSILGIILSCIACLPAIGGFLLLSV